MYSKRCREQLVPLSGRSYGILLPCTCVKTKKTLQYVKTMFIFPKLTKVQPNIMNFCLSCFNIFNYKKSKNFILNYFVEVIKFLRYRILGAEFKYFSCMAVLEQQLKCLTHLQICLNTSKAELHTSVLQLSFSHPNLSCKIHYYIVLFATEIFSAVENESS